MDGWAGYERLVLDKLVTLGDDIRHVESVLGDDLRRVEDKVEALLIDVAMLKVKAGAWGAVAGMIPAAVAIAVSVALG